MQKLCSLHKQVMKIVIIPFHNLTTIAFFASNNITRPKSSVVTAKRPFGANVMLLPWRRESGKPNLTVECIKPKKNQTLTFKTFLSVKLTEMNCWQTWHVAKFLSPLWVLMVLLVLSVDLLA